MLEHQNPKIMSSLRFIRIWTLLLIYLVAGCKEQNYQQPSNLRQNRITSCYIVKPVKQDSKASSSRDFEFPNISLDDFLAEIETGKRSVEYDSTMDYITSFERQRIIIVNADCFGKLSRPDSIDLMNIYFNSGFRNETFTHSIVEFMHQYKKNILQFGDAIVFEYRFNGVSEDEPHFMYIILKVPTEDDRRLGRDYRGFIICSDGLDWKENKDKKFSVPLFIQMVRRNKEFYIPIMYKDERFIPIGHFKTKNWEG